MKTCRVGCSFQDKKMILFKREKEVIDLIRQHVKKVADCLVTSDEVTDTYISGDIKTAKGLARQAAALESDADLIRYDIRDKLYSGAYMPILREDIYKLVESIDKVANAAEACCDFFLNQRPVIPKEFSTEFRAVCKASLGSIQALEPAVNSYLIGSPTIDAVREHTRKVGLIESDVDKLEWDLTKAIFISELEYSHKLHLKRCLDAIVEVSDRAEDTADHLILVTLKST